MGARKCAFIYASQYLNGISYTKGSRPDTRSRFLVQQDKHCKQYKSSSFSSSPTRFASQTWRCYWQTFYNTPLLVHLIVIVDGRLRVVVLKIHMPKTTSSGVTPLFGNEMQIKTLSFTYIPSVHTFLAPGTKVLLQEIIIKPPLPTLAYILSVSASS